MDPKRTPAISISSVDPNSEIPKDQPPQQMKFSFTNLDCKSPFDRLLTHVALLKQQ